MSSGNKYHRTIISLDRKTSCVVDVYAVIVAFDVRCPARQHALKKILCSGIRGKGSEQQDLTESIDAVNRAVDLCKPFPKPTPTLPGLGQFPCTLPSVETIELECRKVSLPIEPGQIMEPTKPLLSDKELMEMLGATRNL